MNGIIGEATVQRGRWPEVLRLALLAYELKLAIVHARSVRQEAVSDKMASVCRVPQQRRSV
jgi:hypothetical protein